MVILLVCGLALLWASGVAYTLWVLTHPPRRTYSSAVARGRAGDPSELETPRRFERWSFRSRRLELPVWDIPGDVPAGPVVIMTHGWADSRLGGLVRLPAIAPLACRVIIWDLPGHGEAPGFCRLGTAEVGDLLALIDHVKAQRLVLMGWSLGAGINLAAAGRIPEGTKLEGIIAEAPYRVPATPASNVLRARGLPAGVIIRPALFFLRAVCGNGLADRAFDRAAAASRAKARVLVVHGSQDLVCPIEDGREIAAAAGGMLVEVQGAGHNDLWTVPELSARCEGAIRHFLQDFGA